jgi:hypothetical protein
MAKEAPGPDRSSLQGSFRVWDVKVSSTVIKHREDTTMNTTRDKSSYDVKALRTCTRCGAPYAWMRSPASLKMTYCGSLCEKADLGFSLEQLERAERPTLVDQLVAVAATAWDEPAPVAAT